MHKRVNTLKNEEIISENESKTWLTRNVLLLGLVSFFADLSGEMMTPVLPLFIIAVGGTEAAVGFIGGLGDAEHDHACWCRHSINP